MTSDAGAEDLRVRLERAERRVATLEAVHQELKDANAEIVERLVNVMLHRDPETGTHLRRIGFLAQALAEHMGQPEDWCIDISLASMLHDIGKVAIPDHVLMEEGALDGGQWEVMRRHPELGAQILGGSSTPLVQMAERIARCHHERWDGAGYPAGLQGNEIPLEAQITSVVDAFDAMMSSRRYKESMAAAVVTSELAAHAGTQFGPDVVRAFLELAPRVLESPELKYDESS